MSLASVLSKEEQDNSLREAIKRVKKSVPPPKYMCLPSTAQIQQRVHLVDSSSEICVELQNMIMQHGMIPDLDGCNSAATVRQHYSNHTQGSDCTKLSTMRQVVERHIKNDWLNVECHKLFWSHIIIGVNAVIRRLQQQRISFHQRVSEPDAITLRCVLLDAGWLASQLGHHISHLCCATGVRLISLRPPGALVQVVASQVKSCKSAMAIGICESTKSPGELVTWLNKVCDLVPPLRLPGATFPGALHLVPPSDSDRSPRHPRVVETCHSSSLSEDKSSCVGTLDSETVASGESWDEYVISEPSRLYVFPSGFQDAGQACTLSELFSHMVSQYTCTNIGEEGIPERHISFPTATEECYTANSFDQDFAPTIIKVVEPLTDRTSWKKKKRQKKNKRKYSTADVVKGDRDVGTAVT